MSFVLDAPVTRAWCIGGVRTAAVLDLLSRAREAGAVAPLLWPLETLNALLVAERRGLLGAATRAELTRCLRALPIALDAEKASRVWTGTAEIAARFRLSACDAANPELAPRRGPPLTTRDRALRQATGGCVWSCLGV